MIKDLEKIVNAFLGVLVIHKSGKYTRYDHVDTFLCDDVDGILAFIKWIIVDDTRFKDIKYIIGLSPILPHPHHIYSISVNNLIVV